ncbi:hypothetical protein [Limnobacter sp.]|uniref:hypothetical protein n=1 Tax=Limnobacter sp. TaxID=2003368 RepID=UPI003120229B
MATFQAAEALRELVDDLVSLVNSPSFQRILAGKKGAAQAENLYVEVLALAGVPTESALESVIQSAIQLNVARKLFRSPHAFAALELRLICGRLCSKFIAEASIAETDSFDAVKAVGLENQILTERNLVHITGNPVNDLVYLDLGQFDRLELDTLLTTSGTALPFQLVKALNIEPKNVKRAYAFIDENLSTSSVRIEAYIRALSLNCGLPFHTPKRYTGTALTRTYSSPTPAQPLEQFSDVQQVLSEYFKEDDLLNRYLRLFQVLENFMVRKQIIKVQRTTGSRAFSIRDFRRLYGETEAKEQATLIDLLENTLGIPTLINGKTLSQIVKDRWDTEIHSSSNQAALANHLLMNYGPFPKKGTIFDTASFSVELGKSGARHNTLGAFVYRFRNMIVHNKETEFHLTHSSISPEIEIVFNKFLLPSVDDIVFALLNIDQNIVWYPYSTISLYKS